MKTKYKQLNINNLASDQHDKDPAIVTPLIVWLLNIQARMLSPTCESRTSKSKKQHNLITEKHGSHKPMHGDSSMIDRIYEALKH